MPYDVHVANSREDAARSFPRLSLSDDIHDLIFCRRRDWLSHAPLLARMNDYYRDATFDVSEVLKLRSEIDQALSVEVEIPVKESLLLLGSVCDTAMSRQASVFCISDCGLRTAPRLRYAACPHGEQVTQAMAVVHFLGRRFPRVRETS